MRGTADDILLQGVVDELVLLLEGEEGVEDHTTPGTRGARGGGSMPAGKLS